eukprot:scaffold218968_cov34-Tisochrysis_lutea.AAC.2
MPPLRDTVCLVDGDGLEPTARVEAQENLTDARCAQPLGRQVQHLRPGIVKLQVSSKPFLSLLVERRAPHLSHQPVLGAFAELVGGECDEWRDNNRDARRRCRRQLVAQRLAEAGGEHDERVSLLQSRSYSPLLLGLERVEAPMRLEGGEKRGWHAHHRS